MKLKNVKCKCLKTLHAFLDWNLELGIEAYFSKSKKYEICTTSGSKITTNFCNSRIPTPRADR